MNDFLSRVTHRQRIVAGIFVCVFFGVALSFILIRAFAGESDAPRSAVSSTVSTETPVEPAGPGWRVETLVTNLLRLDLAVAVQAERTPGLQIALIDVESGKTVARGSFNTFNTFVRLRSNPPQLLISDSDPTTHRYRLLIFDLLEADISLQAQLSLPQRFGYQGFANQMYLSEDQRYLYLPERSLADRPECAGRSFDGPACFEYSIRVIDLDFLASTQSIAPPGRCGSMRLTPVGNDTLVVACPARPVSVVSVVSAAGHLKAVYSYDWSSASDQRNSYVIYATTTEGGAIRALLADGSILGEPGEILSGSLLPPGHELYWTEPMDGARVLVGAGPSPPSAAPASEILAIDLSTAEILAQIPVPANFLGAAIIGPQTAVLLSGLGGSYEIRQVNLADGSEGEAKVLDSLPLEPETIVR